MGPSLITCLSLVILLLYPLFQKLERNVNAEGEQKNLIGTAREVTRITNAVTSKSLKRVGINETQHGYQASTSNIPGKLKL